MFVIPRVDLAEVMFAAGGAHLVVMSKAQSMRVRYKVWGVIGGNLVEHLLKEWSGS